MMDIDAEHPVETQHAKFVYDQLHQECLAYNRAVGSFNRHLKNHRERMNLQDIPYRAPVTTPRDVEGMRALLSFLLDQVHLDSQVRRHPNVAPIHVEALEHVDIARDQLIRTLEGELPST